MLLVEVVPYFSYHTLTHQLIAVIPKQYRKYERAFLKMAQIMTVSEQMQTIYFYTSFPTG